MDLARRAIAPRLQTVQSLTLIAVGFQGVLARSLKRWEERDRPLVKRFYGPRTTRYAPVAYVQVPLVTELVLWSAETLVPTTRGELGPNVALVARSAELLAAVGTTGSTIGLVKDLERLNGELKRLLAGHD